MDLKMAANYCRYDDGSIKKKRSFADIPLEIIEKILFHVNGADLVRCSMVCRIFKEAVQNLIKHEQIWFRCVNYEIEPNIVYEINRNQKVYLALNESKQDEDQTSLRSKCNGIQSVSSATTDNMPGHKNKFNDLVLIQKSRGPRFYHNFAERKLSDNCYDDLYKNTYKLWFRGKNIVHDDLFVQEIDGFMQNPVTCLKLTGKLIVIGHRDGSVSVCDYTARKIAIANRHVRMITDLALIDLAGQDKYHIFDSPADSYSHHHHIISISKDHTIKVFPISETTKISRKATLTFKPSCCELDFCRVFGSHCCVATRNRQIFIFKMHLPQNGLISLEEPLRFEFLDSVLVPVESNGWMNLWDDQISYLCGGSGFIHKFNIKSMDWISTKLLTVRQDLMVDQREHMYIERAYLLRDNIILIVTIYNFILCSIEGESLFDLGMSFKSKVITICLWGSLIAFGLQNGQIHIYDCPTIGDLRNLSKKKPVIQRNFADEICEERVVTIDFDYDDDPVMVAASDVSIQIWKWKPCV